MQIAITTSTFAQESTKPLEILKEHGYKYKLNPYARVLTVHEIKEFLQDCQGVIAGTEQLNADILQSLPLLKVISRCGIGLDNIDLRAAKALGVNVLSTSAERLAQAVAEYTLGLALALLRNITTNDRAMRQGIWQKRMGSLLQGKRLGIVGFGRMGKATAKLFKALGCQVAFTDPRVSFKDSVYIKKELYDLLPWANIISLHASASGLIFGEKEFACMAQGAWFINTARGTLVDEDALYTALASNHLRAAALDVFSDEPYYDKLNTLGNCILSPHICSYAYETRVHMETEAVLNLCNALQSLGVKI